MRQRAKAILLVTWAILGLTGLDARAFDWSEAPGGRTASLVVPATGRTGFTLLSPGATGIHFTNELRGDLFLTNAVAHNGSGVAVGDVNGDDWPDLYFCNLAGPNRLFRNAGSWRFEEQPLTEAACADQFSTAAAFADVDGDSDLDLLVNGIATGTRLFLNDGKGNWTEARNTGLSRTASATSMALADIDGDGDLDLYCTHYIDVMHLADPTTRFALARDGAEWRVSKVNGQPTSLPYWKDRFEALPGGRVRELPEEDGFYRNDGGGRFTAVQSEPGRFLSADGEPVAPSREWGLSVMFRDLDGDGTPDFYVCNDNASPDRLWLNTGNGTFREPAPFTLRHASRSSMALDFADVDRDGHDDLLVLDMLARSPARRMRQLMRDYPDPAGNEQAEAAPRYNRNALFLGRADGSFAEAALMAGVAATDWSWCPVFLDVDLDGYEDLLVCNGFSMDVMDQDSHDLIRRSRLSVEQRKRIRQFHPPWLTENVAFRNRRDGTFEPVSAEWGFDHAGVSYGMALGDLDRDGDLDVVVNNLNENAGVYRNESTAGRIAVRLKGLPPNTGGVGARVRLTGGPVTQTQEIMAGGRYLSCDQAIRVFAADADSSQPLRLEVRWRNGTETTVPVRLNAMVEVIQPPPGAATSGAKGSLADPLWFSDESSLLGHLHVEDDFNDWAVQPLLPRRLSRMGPGLSWYDVNDDGWEDLVVGAARGGRLAVLLNEAGHGFRRLDAPETASDDQGGVVGWPDGKGNRRLLVARSNLALGRATEGTLATYALPSASNPPLLLPPRTVAAGDASPGPLALADVDGDGDLDLFVGGRCRPGRYPEPVSSAIWLNEQDELRFSEGLSQPFASLGLVSGATFCDLDEDGDPDLALAVEWGPVRIFLNDAGRFQDATATWGLAEFTGWWTGIVAGDFDGDGRLDLAAGNWGRNSIHQLDRPSALRLFHGDLDEEGTVEIVEAWRDGEAWRPLRPRLWLDRALPDLAHRIPTHQAYGLATVEEILKPWIATVRTVEANHFDSGVFLNREARFEWKPFPREAQLAPAFGVNVGDFDGDGVEDVFLSQNFFGGGSDLSRDDAGRGLWLRGAGDGSFSAMDSGVAIHGEQRAAALADFDHDGRVDLAVTQNNGLTRLYRNERARPGLRVILKGPPGNPEAVGAQVRARYAQGRFGPSRVIQAGSGYWSQDSATQVLGLSGAAEALWIRWPGGREKVVSLGADTREIVAQFEDGTE